MSHAGKCRTNTAATAAAAAAGPFMDVSAAKPPASQCDALKDFHCLDNLSIIRSSILMIGNGGEIRQAAS